MLILSFGYSVIRCWRWTVLVSSHLPFVTHRFQLAVFLWFLRFQDDSLTFDQSSPVLCTVHLCTVHDTGPDRKQYHFSTPAPQSLVSDQHWTTGTQVSVFRMESMIGTLNFLCLLHSPFHTWFHEIQPCPQSAMQEQHSKCFSCAMWCIPALQQEASSLCCNGIGCV